MLHEFREPQWEIAGYLTEYGNRCAYIDLTPLGKNRCHFRPSGTVLAVIQDGDREPGFLPPGQGDLLPVMGNKQLEASNSVVIEPNNQVYITVGEPSAVRLAFDLPHVFKFPQRVGRRLLSWSLWLHRGGWCCRPLYGDQTEWADISVVIGPLCFSGGEIALSDFFAAVAAFPGGGNVIWSAECLLWHEYRSF